MFRRLGFTITGRNSVPNYVEVSFAVHPDLSLFHFVSFASSYRRLYIKATTTHKERCKASAKMYLCCRSTFLLHLIINIERMFTDTYVFIRNTSGIGTNS